MLKHVSRALALGRITRADAERLLNDWRRCYAYQPYPLRNEEAIKIAYRRSREFHDRRFVAGMIMAHAGAHQTNDPGRE